MSQSFSHNVNSLNNYTTFNVLNNFAVGDDKSNILAWLSPLDPKSRHEDIQGRRIENIGEWLLQTKEFRSWHTGNGGGESNDPVLFCSGDPGVGKTYISSLVIDSLCDQARHNIAVACFYFDFAAQEQSLTSILGAVLKQLLVGLGDIPREIAQAYQEQKNFIGGRRPRHTDIVKMLQVASSQKPTFICIDALDECVPEDRAKLLDSLNQVLQMSPGTRIFVTGRPHIRPEIGRRLAGTVTSLSISTKRNDIIRYLRTRLAEDPTPDAMDSSLEADILKKIPEDVSEIFLLVSLNIDAILQETTLYRRRQKLSAMINGLGLGDAYGATIRRIKGQGGERARLGTAALMWLSHAERPLRADELCHALAVEIESPNLSTDNIPSIGTLLASCQGLVVVEKEVSTVRLIHSTLQEYLRTYSGLFGAAHSTIAETCLTYLNSQHVKAISASPKLQDAPFLEYSSVYWGVHAKRDLSHRAKRLALMLFDCYCHHISTKILLEAQGMHRYAVDFDKPSLFNGLHCASFFGIVEIVSCLVETASCDINQKDFTGNTPLHWAAWNGHEEVVETLLRRGGVGPDTPDNCGRIPLHHAAGRGYEGVVAILLKQDSVNFDKPDNNGQTPLWWAAANGCEGVVTILLGCDDIKPGKSDNDGRTPLWYAAAIGYEGVVKILLGCDDIKPDKSDNDGRTPLWGAAMTGHEGMVETLLRRDDVNPDKPDNDGRTPLSIAASMGCQGVVKILLGRDDVNPDRPDNQGRTPLWGAAWKGPEGVVEMLLGRDGVNPDKSDNQGRTPLWLAASEGREGVVEMLLGRDGVDPDRPDSQGRTPLWLAASMGREAVAKILLGRNEINPDSPDNEGQTPLFIAACCGHEGVVKMLLKGEDVSPNKPDNDGQVPLAGAALNGHEGVVKMLLARDDVKPDSPNINGRTPLWWAARAGHEGVVEILLAREDVSPDKPDKNGQTPLFRAVENGHQGVIALLQPPESIAPNPP